MIDCDRQKQFIKTLKYRYMIATGFNRIKVKCKCTSQSIAPILPSVLIESK